MPAWTVVCKLRDTQPCLVLRHFLTSNHSSLLALPSYQVNLVSDSARGSLVLGTNSALLMGHLNTARMERSVSFKMDQVQAHVVCSETDPQRGPLWLKIANGKLSTPPGAEAIMRQVLLPFKVRTAVLFAALRCALQHAASGCATACT